MLPSYERRMQQACICIEYIYTYIHTYIIGVGFPKISVVPFLVVSLIRIMNCSILWPMLGSPYLGKLPCKYKELKDLK